MNALNQAVAADLSRAFASIGRIAQLRAEARCKQIAQLSAGSIQPTSEQGEQIAREIQAEMIADAQGLIRQTIQFFEAKHQPVKV
jgi:hypothetical protein